MKSPVPLKGPDTIGDNNATFPNEQTHGITQYIPWDKPPKKVKHFLPVIIPILVAIVFILCCTCFYMWIRKKNKNKTSQTTTTDSTSQCTIMVSRSRGRGASQLPARVISIRSHPGVSQNEVPAAGPTPTDPAHEDQGPPEVPPRRCTRGPTKAIVETTRGQDDLRIRVEFWRGGPVGKNKSKFQTTVLGWIHQTTVFPQNVAKYEDVPLGKKRAFFLRLIDVFEIVVVEAVPLTEASSSAPTSSDAALTSSNAAPTHASSTSSAVIPCILWERPGDPTSCLPLSIGHRRVFEGWVRDKFRDYRSDICRRHYDPYQTDEERLANGPPTWPEDMWRWTVHYWGTPEYKGNHNKGKSSDKHTTWSESYQSKHYKIIQETGNSEIDESEFYRDEGARLNSERMEAMTQRRTLESGGRSASTGVMLTNVLWPGTKEIERLQGRDEPKEKERVSVDEIRGITAAYEERMRELERRDEEKTRELERMREQLNLLMQSLQNQQAPPPPPKTN